jgi:ATP-dependent Lhr-like helicase
MAAVLLTDTTPPASLPESLRREVTVEEGRMLLVRGRLEISGPTTAHRIATELGMELSGVQIALEQLELAGVVLRGRFTGSAQDELEWCERRLLARIHRLTLDGLRRQVAPVDAEGFLRFLLAHHQIAGNSRPNGVDGLQRVLSQLEGFEAAVGSWEHDLLPVRMEYESQWLDQLFASGEVVWGRLQPSRLSDDSRGQVLTRVSPISLLRRADLGWLLPPEREAAVGFARWDAQAAYEALVTHGALFFDDLLAMTKLLPSQLEDALRELAALGLVTADGFAAVRSLSSKSRHSVGRRARRTKARKTTYSQGGRWSRFPPFAMQVSMEERAERWAWLLLRRYGVMFRDLLARESVAPAWRDLLPIYRRLEMRGEIRGGRFVGGVAGEQFALPEAVDLLRKFRDQPAAESWSVISAVDPLNLIGIVTRDPRVPALRGNRIAIRNGRPILAREVGDIRWLAEVDEATRWRAERMLTAPGALRNDASVERSVRNGEAGTAVAEADGTDLIVVTSLENSATAR